MSSSAKNKAAIKKFVKDLQTDLNKEAKRQNLSVPMQTDIAFDGNIPTGHDSFGYAQITNSYRPMVEKKADDTVTSKKYDLFISHANSDKIAYVRGLHEALARLGINIFYDEESIEWGDKWKERILEGTATSEFAIIVISSSFFGREWTERELHEFMQRQNDSGQKIILPLLFDVTQEQLKTVYPHLADIQCIETEKHTVDSITVLFAKQLIKRLKEQT